MRIVSPFARGAVLLAVMWNGVIACSTVERGKPSQLEPILVTDVSSVAGMWEGALAQSPPSRRDDWVRLKIQEDGAYHFEAVRTIGMFSGHGKFNVENGKLIARSEKGQISLQLYRHSDKDDRIFKAEGKSGDGMTYLAELTPARRHR